VCEDLDIPKTRLNTRNFNDAIERKALPVKEQLVKNEKSTSLVNGNQGDTGG